MYQRTRTRQVSFNVGVDREAGPGAFARGNFANSGVRLGGGRGVHHL